MTSYFSQGSPRNHPPIQRSSLLANHAELIKRPHPNAVSARDPVAPIMLKDTMTEMRRLPELLKLEVVSDAPRHRPMV